MLPERFSFTQIKDFQNCPRSYYYHYILKVPLKGNHYFSFGSTIHLALQKFYEEVKRRQESTQGGLFDQTSLKSRGPSGSLGANLQHNKSRVIKDLVSFDELLKFYQEVWLDDWYQSKSQKEEYFKKGKEVLKLFYESPHLLESLPVCLEKNFYIKIGGYTLNGKIDRIDEARGGLKIVDYKTGRPKEKLEAEDKEQLLIYQMAASAVIPGKIKELVYYYLENDSQVSFLGETKEIEKLKAKIVATIEAIRHFDFAGFLAHHERCEYCQEII